MFAQSHPYLTFAFAVIGMALALVVLPVMIWRTGVPKAYLAYWKSASMPTPPGTDGISAKRAVFIHAAAVGAFVVISTVVKSGWVWSKESLEAFNTFCYTFAGSYVVGKGLEHAGRAVGAKLAPAPDTTQGGTQS